MCDFEVIPEQKIHQEFISLRMVEGRRASLSSLLGLCPLEKDRFLKAVDLDSSSVNGTSHPLLHFNCTFKKKRNTYYTDTHTYVYTNIHIHIQIYIFTHLRISIMHTFNDIFTTIELY